MRNHHADENTHNADTFAGKDDGSSVVGGEAMDVNLCGAGSCMAREKVIWWWNRWSCGYGR